MKRQSFIMIAFMATMILAGCVFRTNDSEKINLSTERLARIDTMMNEYINSGKLSGATVLISRKNQIAYLKSY